MYGAVMVSNLRVQEFFLGLLHQSNSGKPAGNHFQDVG
jgi:hypothetical protein